MKLSYWKRLRYLLSDYAIPLPVPKRGNGETEWYMGQCYNELISTLRGLALAKQGSGYHIGAIDVEKMAPLSCDEIKVVADFGKRLKKQLPIIKVRHANVTNARSFRSAVTCLIPNLIGVAKILETNNRTRFEIFLRPASHAYDVLNEIFEVARISAEDDHSWASANLCTSWDSNETFQRATIRFHSDTIFEKTWSSKGCVSKLVSLMEDVAGQYPLPPAYQEFVGVSFLDTLNESQRTELATAFWQALFGK